MNQPTKPSPQIIQNDDKVVIISASPLQQFIHQYFILLYLPSTVFLFISFEIGSSKTILAAISLLAILIGLHGLLPSNIIITKESISNNKKSLILFRIPYLDIQAKVLGTAVKIKVGELNFKLKDVADLPILIDIITEKANLEFYENYQLSDNTQVVTYKSKHIKKPVFSTFLIVSNTAQNLKILDMTNQKSWFEIPKNTPTKINFCSLSNANLITETLDINTIQTLRVFIRDKRILLMTDNSTIIFQSYIRKQKDELTNFRDGEKIYDLLKTLPSLAKIEIKKIVVK